MNKQTVQFGYEVSEEEMVRLQLLQGVQEAIKVGTIVTLYYEHPPAKQEQDALKKELRKQGGKIVAEI